VFLKGERVPINPMALAFMGLFHSLKWFLIFFHGFGSKKA
tara:strand:- start:762 stop:881 length:120 start_codon:yes stop_codon:yes gene_type:complete